jgi:hypothetical protein
MQAQIIAEQRKEIARLQKLLAKIEVKKDSEIAGLKAKLAEAKKGSHLTVTRVIISPEDAKL